MDGLLFCPGHCRARQPAVCRRQMGVTLIELLIVVVCIGILTHLALPAFNDHLHRSRLKSVVEDIYGLMILARTEGVIRDQNLSVAMQPEGALWCMGLATTPVCDCAQEMSCTLRIGDVDVRQVLLGAEYRGVTIASNFPTLGSGPTFSRIRGNTPGGTVSVFADHWEAQIRVAPHGRIRVCAPVGGVKNNARLGYPPC